MHRQITATGIVRDVFYEKLEGTHVYDVYLPEEESPEDPFDEREAFPPPARQRPRVLLLHQQK